MKSKIYCYIKPKNIDGFKTFFRPNIENSHLELGSLNYINNNNRIRTRRTFNKYNLITKKIKIKNKLLLSTQEKEQNTSGNISKSNKDLSRKYSKAIDDININFNKILNDKLNITNLLKGNFVFDFDSNNNKNLKNKHLALIKNGKLYWLRKLYIIFQDKLNMINKNKKNLSFYFYYPIKDEKMLNDKFILYQSNQYKIAKNDIFCNNLDDINNAVKNFLKNNNKIDYYKINLYTENFNIFKNDNQLMEKIEKYRIIYAKIKKLSDVKINNTINSFFLHKHLLKIFEPNKKKSNELFNNNKIKTNFSFDKNGLSSKNKFISTTPKFENIKTQTNDNDIIKKEKKKDKFKKTNFNKIINSIDTLILDDMEGIPSFNENKSNYRNFLFMNENHLFHRNKTLNIFNKIKGNNNEICIMKPNRYFNSKKYNIFNSFNSKKSNLFKHKIPLDFMNTNIRKAINLKSESKKLEFEDENNEYKNYKSHENISNNYKFKNNILRTINFFHENNDAELFNEIKKNNYTIYNIKRNNKNHFNNIKSNQYTNIIEINQILFIALNNIIKIFISEEIDKYIKDEEIKILFDIENIIINISNLEIDMNINKYLKEFLFYLYLSNYINLYHTEFCFDLYKIVKNEEYLDINKILSINSFKNLISGVKSILENFKSNKNNVKEKLKENYNKNGQKISFPLFILFLVYNKKNFRNLLYKPLLIDITNSVEINFNFDTFDNDNGIDVEHFIKFRLYLTKNELINDGIKKEFILNFLNESVFKNDNFDKNIFIIKLRPIFNDLEIITKILSKDEYNTSFFNEVYDKFINYFDF